MTPITATAVGELRLIDPNEITIVGVTKMWDRVLTEANLAGVTPHDLRRTFMTTCCELGHPLAIADTLLGHSLGKIRDKSGDDFVPQAPLRSTNKS